jgi:aryl-alcohol dehydrogenase-like predicted oxidoreductase
MNEQTLEILYQFVQENWHHLKKDFNKLPAEVKAKTNITLFCISAFGVLIQKYKKDAELSKEKMEKDV